MVLLVGFLCKFLYSPSFGADCSLYFDGSHSCFSADSSTFCVSAVPASRVSVVRTRVSVPTPLFVLFQCRFLYSVSAVPARYVLSGSYSCFSADSSTRCVSLELAHCVSVVLACCVSVVLARCVSAVPAHCVSVVRTRVSVPIPLLAVFQRYLFTVKMVPAPGISVIKVVVFDMISR